MVLYGRIGSLSFQRFHEQLEYLANNGQVYYILRHYLQVCNTCLIFHVLGFAGFVYHALFRGRSRKFRKKRRSLPLSPLTSLQPDCMITTTLKKQLEGLGSYSWPPPLNPPKLFIFIKHNTCLVKISNIHRLLTVCFSLEIRQEGSGMGYGCTLHMGPLHSLLMDKHLSKPKRKYMTSCQQCETVYNWP